MTRPPWGRLALPLLLLVTLVAGCTHASGREAVLTEGVPAVTTTALSNTGATGTAAAAVAAASPPVPPPRPVLVQNWTPFATAGGIVLHHPASRVERIGFHQSNLDGAQQLDLLATAAPAFTMEPRDRDTTPRGAADVMVDPDAEIRAPVSGKVTYAGTYVLYCQYSDDFLVIDPDEHPGWEVKVLHIDGVRVRPGNRVEAGVTVIAPRATRLPFESQVEEGSYRPVWPHVHVEIDDPNVPDRPTGGGC